MKIRDRINRKANAHFDFNRHKTFANSKRSQHEIVGFVLIVVIVVIIGLFLLVFYLRQEPIEHKSLDVQNFLTASMLYTTECSISIEPLNLEDLIKSCYNNNKCLNDEMACDVLESTLKEILHESWLVSSEKPVNAYSVFIYYKESLLEKKPWEEETSEEEIVKQEILKFDEGNCTGSKAGAERLISNYPGNIAVNMEICYA